MEKQDNIKRAPILYSEAFKRKVCEEYLNGSATKMDLQRKYDIHFKSGIVTWLRKLGYKSQSNFVPAIEYDITLMSMPESANELRELKLQIENLKKQVEDANLKVILYEKLIEITEQDLKISIRKNVNTKQSGK